jgi:hypothetical protein
MMTTRLHLCLVERAGAGAGGRWWVAQKLVEKMELLARMPMKAMWFSQFCCKMVDEAAGAF